MNISKKKGFFENFPLGKLNNKAEKNNFGGASKMKKILVKIKKVFGGGCKMGIKKMVLVLVLFAILSTVAFAATVTHPAENIRAGIFGNVYAGNWSFMNGSVGIGTTNPNYKLHLLMFQQMPFLLQKTN